MPVAKNDILAPVDVKRAGGDLNGITVGASLLRHASRSCPRCLTRLLPTQPRFGNINSTTPPRSGGNRKESMDQ